MLVGLLCVYFAFHIPYLANLVMELHRNRVGYYEQLVLARCGEAGGQN